MKNDLTADAFEAWFAELTPAQLYALSSDGTQARPVNRERIMRMAFAAGQASKDDALAAQAANYAGLFAAYHDVCVELAALRATNPSLWVSVTERLPTEKRCYLTFQPKCPPQSHPMHAVRFDPKDGHWFSAWEVTHWQELPELPAAIAQAAQA